MGYTLKPIGISMANAVKNSFFETVLARKFSDL